MPDYFRSMQPFAYQGLSLKRYCVLMQITNEAGGTLVHLDISSCLSLTDQSCASISKHCKVLEVLGLRNLREIKGTELSAFFLDEIRAKSFRSITLSGSKNVSHIGIW